MTVGITQASTKGVYDIQSNASAFEFRSLNNKSFKVGEKLTYRVHYGFVDAGEATLEVLSSSKKVNGRMRIFIFLSLFIQQ